MREAIGIDGNTGVRFTCFMKATIDIPEELHRKVKAKSALEGRSVREVTVQLFRQWVGEAEDESGGATSTSGERARSKPRWFGALRAYADNADGHHDMDTIRESITRGRARTGRARTRKPTVDATGS